LLITLSGYKPLSSHVKNMKYAKDAMSDIPKLAKVTTEWLVSPQNSQTSPTNFFDVKRAKQLNIVERTRAAQLPFEATYDAAMWQRISSICDTFQPPKCWDASAHSDKVFKSVFNFDLISPELPRAPTVLVQLDT